MRSSSRPSVISARPGLSAWPASILVLAHAGMMERRALPQALALAQACRARLRLRMIVDQRDLPPSSPALMPGSAREGFLRTRRDWLETYRHNGHLDPSRVDVEVLWARNYLRSFRGLMEHTKPDLVLKDSQSNGAVIPALLTPLDWQLLRACPCPMLLAASGGSDLPLRVAAAVDCSEYGNANLNRRIVDASQALALACRAELRLVSVALSPAQGADSAKLPAAYERLRAISGIPRESCDQLSGRTVGELNNYVHAQCVDLLVTGESRRHGLARLVLGSTTEELVVRLRCDALVVPPDA